MTGDPTQRFSNRVENYVKYRPGYPTAVLAYLREACGLAPAAVIADVGSGTGILSEMFLKNGNPVFAIEPNDAMRRVAEDRLSAYPNFASVAGTAEATTLPPASVDLVAAGQAFHSCARFQTSSILTLRGYAAGFFPPLTRRCRAIPTTSRCYQLYASCLTTSRRMARLCLCMIRAFT